MSIFKRLLSPTLPVVLFGLTGLAPGLPGQGFSVEEASITDIQNAIRTGQTTCKQVVQGYLERVKAYNGVCTALVTKDGAPIPTSTGMVRAGAPIQYPTKTVAASTVFPNLDQYKGLPMEFGKMITSVSDPTVKLQYGWRVGIPNAGQLNALETLNIRGERSITCKGDFDRAPSEGPLPPGAPAVCEEFRKQPDALERAEQLDKQYGRNPDLAALPMYCAVFSLKDWYDAKDMRGTGGNDVNFAMDVPKADSPDIAELRTKGAIIFAVAAASNVGGASAAGPNQAKANFPATNLQYAPWSGQTCNPYDTARVPRGTSNGSGVSVAANLSTCSICEQSSASCKGPASRNNIVNLLTTKGILMDGGITGNYSGDRAGIHCKSVQDAALVLDALKGFESEDIYTAIPKGIIPKEPYSSFVVPDSAVKDKPLQGVRVGVVREFMVKHTKNDVADGVDGNRGHVPGHRRDHRRSLRSGGLLRFLRLLCLGLRLGLGLRLRCSGRCRSVSFHGRDCRLLALRSLGGLGPASTEATAGGAQRRGGEQRAALLERQRLRVAILRDARVALLVGDVRAVAAVQHLDVVDAEVAG